MSHPRLILTNAQAAEVDAMMRLCGESKDRARRRVLKQQVRSTSAGREARTREAQRRQDRTIWTSRQYRYQAEQNAKRFGYVPPNWNTVQPPPENGLCQCCHREPSGRGRARLRLHLDHDHKTGLFRGWLCDRCNRGIGMLGDTIDGIQRAMDYFRRSASHSEVDPANV